MSEIVTVLKCGACGHELAEGYAKKTCARCLAQSAWKSKLTKEQLVENKCPFGDKCKATREQGHTYCRNHQNVGAFLDEAEAANKLACGNAVRVGCRNYVSGKFKTCDTCRKKDSESSQARRDAAAAKRSAAAVDDNVLTCTKCGTEQHLEAFVGPLGQRTKHCQTCRNRQQVQEAKRDTAHVNARQRVASKAPERVAVKQAYQEAHPVQMYESSLTCRQRQKETMGLDDYKAKAAKQAADWREANPEKMVAANEDRKANIGYRFKNYQNRSAKQGVSFQITLEEFAVFAAGACFYCGDDQNAHGNGIDKVDQLGGYVAANCVSCCKLCNHMKGCLDANTFAKRAVHIASFQEKVPEESKCDYLDAFDNSSGVSYAAYKARAERKSLAFEMTKAEYDTMTHCDCYLCGRAPSNGAWHGVDRVNNACGYTADNTQGCCSGCNYLKNKFDFDAVVNKCAAICGLHGAALSTSGEVLPGVAVNLTHIRRQPNKLDCCELDLRTDERKRKSAEHHATLSDKTVVAERVAEFARKKGKKDEEDKD
jgi:hypothetical protein